MIFTRDRLTFDRRQFDFVSLVEKEIGAHLATSGRPPLASLDQIHDVEGIETQLEGYRQLLFALFRKECFQRVYCSLGKKLIDEHFSKRALIQKTPTVRIHLAGGNSVSFHSDAWYGHGRRVYSFWLPLTGVFGSNSLQMARSLDESQAFLREVETRQLDLDEINALAAGICEPITAQFGELIVFSAEMVHGTTTNETRKSRISFDFRIAESADDIGNKPQANFYNYDQLASGKTKETAPAVSARSYSALLYSGTCRGISAKSQLVFLNEYARMNNIQVVGGESEIVVFDYAPVLQKYAKNPAPNMNSVLLFSVDLLPRDEQLRHRIYRSAIARQVAIIFGAEDCVLNGTDDIEQIERRYHKCRQAA
jgi:sporadic carbohydrate cluster protein (TIGR04323 family)